MFQRQEFFEINSLVIPEIRKELAINRQIFNKVIDALTDSLTEREKKKVYLYGTGNILNFLSIMI